MKRFTAVLIILAAVLLTSCRIGSADITDADARQILSELIPKAAELNEIFLGKGLEPSEYLDTGISTTHRYIEVSANSPYQTVGELASAAESVFSSEYCSILFESAFYGTEDFQPRYSESESGVLQINVNDEGYKLRTVLYPETAVVKNKFDGRTAVSVQAEFDGKPYDDVIVYLVNENGRWLIDSPTY